MIPHNAFGRMWIVIPETLQDLLRDGRVLSCSHEAVQFALALADHNDAALERRADLERTGGRPAYALLLDAEQFQAIEDAEPAGVQVDVLDGHLEVEGTIQLTGTRNNQLRTEHGLQDVTSTVLSNVSAGDLFSICERHALSREWVVYRALTDGTDGSVEAQYTVDADRPTRTFTGEDQVVFLLTSTAAILYEISAREVAAS